MQRKKMAALATATLTGAAFMVPLTASQVNAVPSSHGDAAAAPSERAGNGEAHDLTMPWQKKYQDIHQNGVEQKLRSGSRRAVQKVAKGQFADTAQTGEDRIFVVIAEFGNERHSRYCDQVADDDPSTPPVPAGCDRPSDGSPQRYDGPLHNQIPEPNRRIDNSTNWQADYDHAHYQNMYFQRMRRFYEKQSLGKYSFSGDVTEWVKVPYNEARYGRDYCGSIVCASTWWLIRDGLSVWTQQQLDSGKTMEEIQAYLKTFDHQDRYDYDGDGDFDEPDGYIDHFQIVHAGGDQADGDEIQASDAIWSHRWYAQIHQFGSAGPEGFGEFGGVNVGEGGVVTDDADNAATLPDNPTGVWVGDYTIQPENGGLSVFAHEYGHDLGLPDLYDTSGNTGGAENSVGWWSLMSQSRGTLPKDDGIGDRPMPFGAWDKFQLGWLNYRTIRAGHAGTFKIRPGQSTRGHRPNGLIVILPDKQVTTELGAPCSECGERYYYSGSGDDLNVAMTRAITGGGALTAKVRYDIESGFDYAFLESSSDGGATWQRLMTSKSVAPSEGGTADGTGITGSSDGQWVDLTASVPADADTVRWHYVTDGGVAPLGFMVDNMAIDGVSIGTAESGNEGWVMQGFRTTTGTETNDFLNAYFVDNRQPRGLDKPLTHLYNFGFSGRKANFVEFFHNQPGALISYWDTSQTDNNVGDHPGSGEILPVDANPEFNHTPDGEIARPRLNSWDSTFSVNRSRGQTLHQAGVKFRLRGQKAVRQFNDNLDYWFKYDEHGTAHDTDHFQAGWYSVDVPHTGTQIRVLRVNRKTGVMKVRVH